MLENWLQPPSKIETSLPSWQIGANIIQHTSQQQFPELRTAKVALLGIGEEVDIIRNYLYQMGHPFRKFPIVDIGNLRNSTDEVLLPVLTELLGSKIFPIIISSESLAFTAQFKAYKENLKKVNFSIVNERIAYHKDHSSFLSVLHKVKKPKLANLALIGYQGHLCPIESIHYYQKKNYDLFRLGKVKTDIEQVEPIIRDADTMYFNLSAIKQVEAPGTHINSPSGFTSEEACRICHYAGISDKLTSAGFYGYCKKNDQSDQTAKLIAQMVWYLMEGIYHRKKDFPASTDRMVEYVVSLKDSDYNLTFWKSNKSSRWWIELPSRNKTKNQLIPCSYEDYQLACRDELSQRLLNVIERYTE